MKKGLGCLMMLPLPAMIAIVAPTCERGRVSGSGGHSELYNNGMALLLMVSVGLLGWGISLFFAKPPPPPGEGGPGPGKVV